MSLLNTARCGGRFSTCSLTVGHWTLRRSTSQWTRCHGYFRPMTTTERFNPLRDILAECIDFEASSAGADQSFLTATNVRTGQAKCSVTRDHARLLMASACLPTIFQAVEIDGEDYWDGGYIGNPRDPALGAGMRVARYNYCADQPGRTPGHAKNRPRHPQSHQRDHLQFRSAEGVAHDSVAAAGRRLRGQRGRVREWACMRFTSRKSWSTSAIPRSSMPSGIF